MYFILLCINIRNIQVISLILHFCSILLYLESDAAGWGPWSPWSPCSSSCFGGIRNRYRFCDTPPPKYGARFCQVNIYLLMQDSINVVSTIAWLIRNPNK